MRIVGVGDAILNRRLSRLGSDDLLEVAEFTRAADAAYVNFEMVTPSAPMIPGPIPIAMRLAGPSWIIPELEWMGFDLFGTANNHAADYGFAGLLDTVEQFERRGLNFAGAGRSLEEARRPTYLETDQGRVAMLSATSSGADLSLAADGYGPVAARPGTNPLRFKTEYQLGSDALLRNLAEIDREMGSAQTTQFMRDLGVFPGFNDESETAYHFLGKRFVRGEDSRIVTAPLARDISEISRWIDEARRSAEYVVVGLHCHEGAADGWNIEAVADFVGIAARAFIDAGADIIFGHGPHRLRGVEIYHDRPIFYSLGNFLFLDESISIVDPEQFLMFGMPRDSTPADLHEWRANWPDGRPRGFHSQQAYWDSVIAQCVFDEDGCSSVELYPLDLGLQRPHATQGIPHFADRQNGERILKEIGRMSWDGYSTEIAIVTHGSGVKGVVALR